MSNPTRSVDCLVIGGGLAGAMAGLRLAQAGREVLLLERERKPAPKVCGEFLSAEALAYLHHSGVDPVALGARPLAILRFSAGKHTVEARLPFPALALSRTVLDEHLLQRAADLGCEVVRGVTVDKLTSERDHWLAHADETQIVHARNLFLATGKHDLRGWARSAGKQNDLIGFKMRWLLTPSQEQALAGSIELAHFPGGYCGLVEVEDGSANLALVVKRRVFRELNGWAGLISHIRAHSTLLQQRLAGAQPAWDRPLAISSLPYGYMAHQSDGCWRIGDQAAVIPSFTGDGMAIALHSAVMAVDALLDGLSIDQYQGTLAAQLTRSMTIATALSRLMASRVAHVLAPAAMPCLPFALRWIARSTRIPAERLLLQLSHT